MGWKDITAGDKVAKPLGARFIKAKTGTIGLEVGFQFTEPSTKTEETLNAVFWLSKEAIERSLQTLVEVLGFNGNETCNEDGILTDKEALDYSRQVKLVVEMESYGDKDGKEKQAPKIKWVNALGGSSFASCTPVQIKNDLGALGFRAAFLAAKQGAPKTGKQPQSAMPEAKKEQIVDDLPY